MAYLCLCKFLCRLKLVGPFAESVLVKYSVRLDHQWSPRVRHKGICGTRWGEFANQSGLDAVLEQF